MKFTVSQKEKSKFEAGLRGFFQYRDLGIDAATKGSYGANVIRAVPGKHSRGEWHLHKLNFQMIASRMAILYLLCGGKKVEGE